MITALRDTRTSYQSQAILVAETSPLHDGLELVEAQKDGRVHQLVTHFARLQLSITLIDQCV